MHVTHLVLDDFRNYEHVEVDFSLGINVLIGRNGQGKTNIVEAIGYIATHGSHRVSQDAPLVRAGAKRSIIRCSVSREDRDVLIELEINPGQANRARVNRSPVNKTRDALGIVRTVLFAPEDLNLVKGDPAERRAFIDSFLTQRTPKYASVKSDFERVVKQRNSLLKSAKVARNKAHEAMLETLHVWDEQLVNLGSDIICQRQEILDELNPIVRAHYLTVSNGQTPTTLTYATALDDIDFGDNEAVRQAMVDRLAKVQREELDRGVTLVGPHRDDIAISLGDLPAKGYASHGESWSIALALRLACFDLLNDDLYGDPVLILDDVFAELDSVRRRKLTEVVATAHQVIITAAVESDVPDELTGKRFVVEAGHVR